MRPFYMFCLAALLASPLTSVASGLPDSITHDTILSDLNSMLKSHARGKPYKVQSVAVDRQVKSGVEWMNGKMVVRIEGCRTTTQIHSDVASNTCATLDTCSFYRFISGCF